MAAMMNLSPLREDGKGYPESQPRGAEVLGIKYLQCYKKGGNLPMGTVPPPLGGLSNQKLYTDPSMN